MVWYVCHSHLVNSSAFFCWLYSETWLAQLSSTSRKPDTALPVSTPVRCQEKAVFCFVERESKLNIFRFWHCRSDLTRDHPQHFMNQTPNSSWTRGAGVLMRPQQTLNQGNIKPVNWLLCMLFSSMTRLYGTREINNFTCNICLIHKKGQILQDLS